MVKVKVANPAPLGLWVVNPSRSRKKMATKRRSRKRSTARRSNTTAATHRKRTTRRRSNPTVHASTRRHHVARRRHTRRRNPAVGGLAGQAIGLAAGITVVGLAQSFIPPLGGVSPVAVAARQAATGWLIGEGMQRFGVMRAYAADVKIGGFALGIGTLINAWVLPLVTGFLRPAPAPQPAKPGMADLVTLPAGNYDPYYGSTPKIGGAPVRTNKAAALKDLLAMPAMPGAYQRFGR